MLSNSLTKSATCLCILHDVASFLAIWALLGACQGFLQRFNLRLMKQSPGSLHRSVNCAGPVTVFFPPKTLPRFSAAQNNANSRRNTLAHIHSIPFNYTVSMTAIVQNCKARLANSDLPMRCFDTKKMWRHPVCIGEVCEDSRTNRTGLDNDERFLAAAKLPWRCTSSPPI